MDYSLELFLSFDQCKKVVIMISKEDPYCHKLTQDDRVNLVEGGLNRAESVKIGFDYLTEKGHIENVLIHDAARPCVLNEEVEEFLTQFCSSENSGAIFATPCSDTLKASSDGVRINQTVDRSELWQAQTPQVFRHTNLMQAYEVNKIEMNKLTDESSLFDKLDDDIFLFQSSANNIKITFQEDLRLAESIINIKRN